MKFGMSIQDLVTEVQRQATEKRDFIASTRESYRMVEIEGESMFVVLREGGDELERFKISRHCHNQIASRLQIPWRYYQRLLTDHPDMVRDSVNKLFEREPEMRMLRTLDGYARAFLSDRFNVDFDNVDVLGDTLPVLYDSPQEIVPLSTNITAERMDLKLLFTDDSLAIDLGTPVSPANDGWAAGREPSTVAEEIAQRSHGRDIVRPGLVMSNSEVGLGKLKFRAFFYRDYCTNGCVFGTEDAFSFARSHIGGRLVGDASYQIVSQGTKQAERDLIVSQVRDGLSALVDPQRVQAMGDHLRRLKNATAAAQEPQAAVEVVVKELEMTESEGSKVLENLLGDRDLSQWGMLNAVTKVANEDDVTYERACEIEELGAKIASWGATKWAEVAQAEKVAA